MHTHIHQHKPHHKNYHLRTRREVVCVAGALRHEALHGAGEPEVRELRHGLFFFVVVVGSILIGRVCVLVRVVIMYVSPAFVAPIPPHCMPHHPTPLHPPSYLVPPLLDDAREHVDVPRQKDVGAVDVAVHDGGAEAVDVGGPAGDVLCVRM